MLKAIKDHLKSKSIKIGAGAIMDAKRLSAPSSTKNAKGKRDPKIRPPRHSLR
jgi:IS5 family transposase